ncbi:MAG: DUF6282 family protein [Thermodesulfobacteriota bacterium]
MSGEIDLIKGGIDIHVHAAPDIQDRKTDCLEIVQKAREYGMGGILIKDHVTVTSDRAYILNHIFPDFKVYGSIVLNYPVGGLNPSAVEGAIGLGCRFVFMPTYCALNHISVLGKVATLHANPLPKDAKGISLLDAKGKLVSEVYEILEIIAKAKVTLATGHISPEETMKLLKAANQHGVERIIVTHASFKRLTFLDLPDQIEAVRMGAFIEHCFVVTTEMMRPVGITTIEEIGNQIRAVGTDHCVLSTDFGQTGNPHPVEGFRQFALQMFQIGFFDFEIKKMIKLNPLRLLED